MSPYCRHALKRNFQTLSTASHFSGGSSSKTATLPRDVRISYDFADNDLGCSPLLSTSPSLAQPPTRIPSSVKRRLFNSTSPGHVTQNTDVNTKKQYHNTSDSQASPSVAVSVLSPLPVSKSLPTPVLKRRCLHFKELSNSPSITRRTLPHVNNTASSAEITPNKLQESHLDEQQRVIDVLNTQVTPSSGVNVIGDFGVTHSLPTTPGYHSDVQYITPQTLESLLTDTNKQGDKNVLIIDCRYPYEFNGGHIQGTVNIYTKETIHEELLSSSSRHRNERTIVIFHCEFSSERAPNMYRFLREQDRAAHADCYPQLHYPEMYVLHGGYKAFYEQCGTEQCQPKSYRPMLHQQYQLELKNCRRKTKMWGRYKSWHGADVQRVAGPSLFYEDV